MLTSGTGEPLYLQLKNHLLEDISAGAHTKGQRITTKNDLAQTFSVSRITVRKALKELEQEDLNDASLIQVLADKYNIHFTGTGPKTLKLVYTTYEQTKYPSLSKGYPLISIACVSFDASATAPSS